MTIQVKIENMGKDRNLIVEAIEYDKFTGKQNLVNLGTIKPQGAQTFHVHLLCDLRIGEERP